MKWNKKNIEFFEEESIGFINRYSFDFDTKTIRITYKNCSQYPFDKFDGDDFGNTQYSYRNFYWENLTENDDLTYKLLIYLQFVENLSVKFIDYEGEQTLYLSLHNQSPTNESFTTLIDSYNFFFRHLNINNKNITIPVLDYYQEEYDRWQEENRRINNSIISPDQMYGNDFPMETNPPRDNDELDLNQQSQDYWNNS